MGRPTKNSPGRARLLFKQTEVARAVKGAQDGGLEVVRVKITRSGDIIIEATKMPEGDPGITEKPKSIRQETSHPVSP